MKKLRSIVLEVLKNSFVLQARLNQMNQAKLESEDNEMETNSWSW